MTFYFLTEIQTIMDKSLGTNLHLWRDCSLEKNPSECKRRKLKYDSSEDDPKLLIASPLRGSGDFFNGKTSISNFAKGKRTVTTEGIVQMLFNATNDDVKCRELPKQVQIDAVFLIDPRFVPLNDL